MSGEIVLVTSIAPKNLENQRLALGSWINQGFKIISCNTKGEIACVHGMFPDIEFVEVTRDARDVIGKPCPYIYDMFQILKERANHICGIVNSDIHLRKCSKGLYAYLMKEAEKSVIFMRRQEVKDVSGMDRLDSSVFFGGIDTFLFQKDVIDLIEDDGLILGQAMWDYWFPIVLGNRGIKVRELINPVTFHITHAVQWDDEMTGKIAERICRRHFKEVKIEDAVFFLKDRFFQMLSPIDLAICYVPEAISHKRVLILGEEADMVSDAFLQRQTYGKVSYAPRTRFLGNYSEYDYIMILPYAVEMSDVFVAASVWIMENYHFSAIQPLMYLRGNKSNAVKIENCNDSMLKRFNSEIDHLVICKSEDYRVCRNGSVDIQSCQIAMCSIIIEEDESVIWERERFSGRTLVFPAGYIARTWVKRYRAIAKEIKIVGFVDNAPGLHHMIFDGLEVYPPGILERTDLYDKILVITNLYAEEIYCQLMENVKGKEIIIWDEFDGKKWNQTRGQIRKGQ